MPLLSFGPPPTTRREERSMLPWWRRLGAWLGDFPKFVGTMAVMCSATIAVHVWLKGLITRAELDVSVEAAVTRAVTVAIVDARVDIENLKSNTGGLPPWRADISTRIVRIEAEAAALGRQAENNQRRLDMYLTARGR